MDKSEEKFGRKKITPEQLAKHAELEKIRNQISSPLAKRLRLLKLP